MNDLDLEARLKAVHVPERSEEYWSDFPSRVRMLLPRAVPVERPHWHRAPRWGWNGGLALACVLLIALLAPVFHAALKDESILRRDAAQLPQKMRVLMADEHGMQNLITDSE